RKVALRRRVLPFVTYTPHCLDVFLVRGSLSQFRTDLLNMFRHRRRIALRLVTPHLLVNLLPGEHLTWMGEKELDDLKFPRRKRHLPVANVQLILGGIEAHIAVLHYTAYPPRFPSFLPAQVGA